MMRHRSSTVVESIALNVPILDQFEQLHHHENGSLQRSSSFGEINQKTHEKIGSIITPFLKHEKEIIWHKLIDANENKIDIDIQDEMVVEDLQSNMNNDNAVAKAGEFIDFLTLAKAQNSSFIDDTEKIITNLDKLLTIHVDVTAQTRDFQSESNQLISELDKLDALHSDLTEKFVNFQHLESIVKKLNTVNNSKIVLKQSFNETVLLKLDASLAFVRDPKHSHYKDIALYKHRFSQCMMRALSLIRNYLVTHIASTGTKINEKINGLPTDKDNSIVIDALVNTTFSESMSSIYSLFHELYIRATTLPGDDYYNLLDDVYNQYLSTRGQLISTHVVGPHMRTFNADFAKKDLVSLASASLNFFLKIASKEYDLFATLFFIPPTDLVASDTLDNTTNIAAAHRMLESMLDPLYYLLRNRILREQAIPPLCELITLIKTYSEAATDGVDIETLLKPILEDAQTRLMFRVHKYVESNVVNYKKTGQELVITNKVSTIVGQTEDIELASLVNVYPPVAAAVHLLTQIYQLLTPIVFDDITSSMVHLTLLALRRDFGDVNSLDAKLYSLRSLIKFRENLDGFEIEHARREISLDFSGLRKLYERLRPRQPVQDVVNEEQGTLFDAVLGSVPKVVNDFVDCRVELQVEIRRVVHEFIELCVRNVVPEFPQEYTVSSVQKVNDGVLNGIKTEVPRLRSLVKEFVHDGKVGAFLMDGVQQGVQAKYDKYYGDVIEKVDGEVLAVIVEPETVGKVWADAVKKVFAEEDEEDDVYIEDEDDKDADDIDDGGEMNTANSECA